MEEKQVAQIVITWDRENGQSHYTLAGLTHQEAIMILLAVLGDNFSHALAEASGQEEEQ